MKTVSKMKTADFAVAGTPATPYKDAMSMTVLALAHEFTALLASTASNLKRLAELYVALGKKGFDTSKLDFGLTKYLGPIAANKLLPAAALKFEGREALIDALTTLPLDVQATVLADNELTVLRVVDGVPTAVGVPLRDLTAKEIRQAIDMRCGELRKPAAPDPVTTRRGKESSPESVVKLVLLFTRTEHAALLRHAAAKGKKASTMVGAILREEGLLK